MIGDQEDMRSRLLAVLPTRWFPDVAPILNGLLSGMAWAWAWLYALFTYAGLQTRIHTATDIWLDMIAADFFGNRVLRLQGQGDDAFRARIMAELFRERATRAAVTSVLTDLTGRPPVIFEPARTTDTGGYGTKAMGGGALAYGKIGRWGSLDLPFQSFVTAYRPLGSGIAQVAGYGSPSGGYGHGIIEYCTLSWVEGVVTDSDIYAAIADVLPAGTIAWTQISN